MAKAGLKKSLLDGFQHWKAGTGPEKPIFDC
jgi:hypothetical protein